MDGRDFLRSDVAVFWTLILMVADVLIVSLIAIGSVVLVGVLGYLIEKKGAEDK